MKTQTLKMIIMLAIIPLMSEATKILLKHGLMFSEQTRGAWCLVAAVIVLGAARYYLVPWMATRGRSSKRRISKRADGGEYLL